MPLLRDTKSLGRFDDFADELQMKLLGVTALVGVGAYAIWTAFGLVNAPSTEDATFPQSIGNTGTGDRLCASQGCLFNHKSEHLDLERRMRGRADAFLSGCNLLRISVAKGLRCDCIF